MSDEEVICAFMEPVPPFPPWSWRSDITWGQPSPGYWHFAATPTVTGTVHGVWIPRQLTLDAVREVQERLLLTSEQWSDYIFALASPDRSHPIALDDLRGYLSATVEQKVQALAAVIRAQKENA